MSADGNALHKRAKRSAVNKMAVFQRHQTEIYLFTFLAYGVLHLSRKTYANLKVKLEANAMFDPTFLSVMDTTFMLFYAIGSFFSGALGDFLSAPKIVAIGLIGSGICVLLLAVCVWVKIETSKDEFWRTFTPLVIMIYLKTIFGKIIKLFVIIVYMDATWLISVYWRSFKYSNNEQLVWIQK
jgi:sugar phosphate permease